MSSCSHKLWCLLYWAFSITSIQQFTLSSPTSNEQLINRHVRNAQPDNNIQPQALRGATDLTHTPKWPPITDKSTTVGKFPHNSGVVIRHTGNVCLATQYSEIEMIFEYDNWHRMITQTARIAMSLVQPIKVKSRIQKRAIYNISQTLAESLRAFHLTQQLENVMGALDQDHSMWISLRAQANNLAQPLTYSIFSILAGEETKDNPVLIARDSVRHNPLLTANFWTTTQARLSSFSLDPEERRQNNDELHYQPMSDKEIVPLVSGIYSILLNAQQDGRQLLHSLSRGYTDLTLYDFLDLPRALTQTAIDLGMSKERVRTLMFQLASTTVHPLNCPEQNGVSSCSITIRTLIPKLSSTPEQVYQIRSLPVKTDEGWRQLKVPEKAILHLPLSQRILPISPQQLSCFQQPPDSSCQVCAV